MADCSKCIHIDVCGKLIFFGGNCNKECIHYKDGSVLMEVDKFSIRLHHIIIDNEGVPEVKLQIGDRYCILHTDPVDVVEVVRCKDCKWIEKGKDYAAYCNHWKSGLFANVKDNDFCSYGERGT